MTCDSGPIGAAGPCAAIGSCGATGPVGATGSYGPNDNGYINGNVRRAADSIQNAIILWCEGHYPHSNARVIPDDHPLVLALHALAEVDQSTCEFANVPHDPALFTPYKPTEEAQHRWDWCIGPPGVPGSEGLSDPVGPTGPSN